MIELTAEDLAEIASWSPAEWKRVFEEIRKAPVADEPINTTVGRATLKIRKYTRRKKAA